MKKNILKTVETLLFSNEAYVSEDGRVLKAKVREDLEAMDERLMSLLTSNKDVVNHFFVRVKDTLVFDTQKFIWFIESKEFLPDSFTGYSNKIGLSFGGNLISQSNKVVLDFPYKDCVLEGGQDKEDQKRNEIFFNETIASEEISRMLSPKVFTNAIRHKAGGIEESISFEKDDNLIIKGNNLVTLSSLLKKYSGKVKCIYIDPPYNTFEDSFGYNDKFSKSTWLTFMKNRLEIAKRLLSDDGVILIQISFHQYPYLRVMADEIFSEECHKLDFNILVRHPERSLTSDKEFNDVIEYTLVYSKSRRYKMPKQEIDKIDDDYKINITFKKGPMEIIELGGKSVEVYHPEDVIITKGVGYANGLKSVSVRGSIKEKNSSGRFYVANIEPIIDKYPKATIFAVPNIGDDGLPYRLFETPRGNNKNGVYYQGKPKSSDVTSIPYPNFLDFVEEYNVVNKEGEVSFRNGKKPEEMISFFLSLFSEEGDTIVDFFLGSGTTAAVAHKMKRHYIGIEQMDYIQNIAVERLKKVIQGEQGGISEKINWKGGGSFVYCELKENALELMSQIQSATDTNISEVTARVVSDTRILDYITTEEIMKIGEEFDALSLDEKKKALMHFVDKNKLYVNYSDMEDEDYAVNDVDKKFTKSFYEKV